MCKKLCLGSLLASILALLYAIFRSQKKHSHEYVIDEVVYGWNSIIEEWNQILDSLDKNISLSELQHVQDVEDLYNELCQFLSLAIYTRGTEPLNWIERYGHRMPEKSLFKVFPGDLEGHVTRTASDWIVRELTLFAAITEGNSSLLYV